MTEPRSWLFVPADSERKIAKALDSDADAVIFDLEDSVAPAHKAAARDILKQLAEAVERAANGGCGSIHSVSEFHKDDLTLIASAYVHGIVLPKAESGADVTQLAHRTGNIPIHAIVTETAASLFGLLSYRDPKSPLAAMSWGAEDLSAALGASSKYDANGELSFTYQACALAVPRRRGRRRRPAGRRRVRRLQRRQGPARRSRGRSPRRLHRQARHPSRRKCRSSTPPSPRPPRRSATPKRSSPRSKPIPTPECCRSTAKWSTGRTLCRPRRVLERMNGQGA